MGCHFLLPGDPSNPGIKRGLPHWRQILYCLRHQGSPKCSKRIIKRGHRAQRATEEEKQTALWSPKRRVRGLHKDDNAISIPLLSPRKDYRNTGLQRLPLFEKTLRRFRGWLQVPQETKKWKATDSKENTQRWLPEREREREREMEIKTEADREYKPHISLGEQRNHMFWDIRGELELSKSLTLLICSFLTTFFLESNKPFHLFSSCLEGVIKRQAWQMLVSTRHADSTHWTDHSLTCYWEVSFGCPSRTSKLALNLLEPHRERVPRSFFIQRSSPMSSNLLDAQEHAMKGSRWIKPSRTCENVEDCKIIWFRGRTSILTFRRHQLYFFCCCFFFFFKELLEIQIIIWW